MAATLEPARAPVAVAMTIATLWSTAPLVALLCSSPAAADSTAAVAATEGGPGAPGTPDTAPVLTVIRIGDEPEELVAGSVALARTLGPVAVVGRHPATALGQGIIDHCGVPVGAALSSIAEETTSPAMLIISGRVAVLPDGARRAAAPIPAGAGWVTGRTRSFNDDRFVSERRDLIGGQLRHRARATGLTLWEPDATLVAASLLREDVPVRGRPYGRWLRARAAAGATGVITDDEPALRAAPVASRDHWPDALARRRAAVADLADALIGRGAGSGGIRGRCTAAALLLRELYAWPLLVWLAAPVLLSAGLPFRVEPALGAATLLCLAVARWAALRHALGVPLTPRADVLAAINGIPGSLWALTNVLTRRVRRPRRAAPVRPLVWLALPAVATTGVGLVRIEPGTPGSRTVALLCIALLVGLWTLTVRSLVERTWERTSFRLPVALPAEVDGHTARIVDAGPAGVAVALVEDPGSKPGDGVVVEVTDDATTGRLRLTGVVRSRRQRGATSILGVELRSEGAERESWILRLASAVATPDDGTTDEGITDDGTTDSETHEDGPSTGVVHESAPVPLGRVGAVLDRTAYALVMTVSVIVLAALLLVLLGFRPLVIRSGSMAPAYQAGDLVITDRIQAGDIEAGDVVSLDHYAPIGESMTHRVQDVERSGGAVRVTTRGDANDSSETWSVAADQVVGKVVTVIPSIGRPAILVRTSWTVALLASLLVAPVVLVILRDRKPPRRRSSRRAGPPPEP